LHSFFLSGFYKTYTKVSSSPSPSREFHDLVINLEKAKAPLFLSFLLCVPHLPVALSRPSILRPNTKIQKLPYVARGSDTETEELSQRTAAYSKSKKTRSDAAAAAV
jgi:hypothetical protein